MSGLQTGDCQFSVSFFSFRFTPSQLVQNKITQYKPKLLKKASQQQKQRQKRGRNELIKMSPRSRYRSVGHVPGRLGHDRPCSAPPAYLHDRLILRYPRQVHQRSWNGIRLTFSYCRLQGEGRTSVENQRGGILPRRRDSALGSALSAGRCCTGGVGW